MKKAFKITFIYLGVILLALVATVIFCGAFLFFYRDGNIFGIQYISKDEVVYSKTVDGVTDLDLIEINSSKYKVVLEVNKNVSTVRGAIRNKVFGYAKKSKAQAELQLGYSKTAKSMVFNAVEPQGWLNRKGSYVTVVVPDELVNDDCDIKIKTDKGDITVDGKELLNVGNLTVESAKGDINISNLNINKDVRLICGSGTVYFNEKCEAPNETNINIRLNSGKINLTQIDTEKFKINTVNVEKLTKGEIYVLKANELKTEGNINGGGEIQVGEVEFVNFASLDTDVKINKINMASKITITGYGMVAVKQVYGDLVVNGHDGDINIAQSVATLVLTSVDGDINANNVMTKISTDSKYGNTKIKFSQNAADYDSVNECRMVLAKTEDGRIEIDGLQKGSVEATGSGSIKLNYNKVIKDNIVKANSGSVYVVVPAPAEVVNASQYALNLIVESKVATDIKVGLAGSIQIDTEKNAGSFRIYTTRPAQLITI